MPSSSAHPLGGASRPGRVLGPALDRIIKNATWRKHTHLVSSCRSALDLLQPLADATDDSPNSHSALVGVAASTADALLSPLLLALDPSNSPNLIDPAVDCLLRLLSLRLLRGEISPSGPTPILSRLLSAATSALTCSDPAVELAVLRLFVAVARSDAVLLRSDALALVVENAYNVYLGSQSTLNQLIAKLVLAQFLTLVFAKVEADSMASKAKTVSVVDLLDLSDKSLNDASLVQAAQNFINEAMELSGDGGGESKMDAGRSEEGEEGLSKIREDGILLFRDLCKLSMKFAPQEGTEDPLLLRGKVLSLELLKMVMENAGTVWRTNDK